MFPSTRRRNGHFAPSRHRCKTNEFRPTAGLGVLHTTGKPSGPPRSVTATAALQWTWCRPGGASQNGTFAHPRRQRYYEMLPEFPLSQSQVAPGIQNNSESSPQQKIDVAGVSHAPERKPSTRRSSTPTSTRRLVRGPPQRPPRVARTPLTQRVGFCFGPAPFAVALFSLQLRTAPRVQCRSLIRQPTTTTANKQQHGVLVVVGTEHDEVAHEHVETARREVRVLVPHVEGPLDETSPAASFA